MQDNKKHQKHADLPRPVTGNFGRLELAILGAPCDVIEAYAFEWAGALGSKYKLGYADADHLSETSNNLAFQIKYTDKINHHQLAFSEEFSLFKRHALFNDADLVFVNGNHFDADKKILMIHPGKSLEKKLDKLNNVALILLTHGEVVPAYIKAVVQNFDSIPQLALDDLQGITNFLSAFLQLNTAPLKGLVLAGGKSTRMQVDKASIAYHGKSQRDHNFDMLAGLCSEVFISSNRNDSHSAIADTFTGLGPFGGILSAMQKDPNAAWLTVACDLPYLTHNTLQFLADNRDPSKLATAFMDSDNKYPEPLITIWEPRAYPIMLQFLGQGYSCPRKVLINSDIKLLTAPDVSEFRNVNTPEERDEALRFFETNTSDNIAK